MAQKTVVTITDDLDQSPDAKPRTFAVNGINYSIDLTDENHDKAVEALAPYIAAARRGPGGQRTRTPGRRTDGKPNRIREWAQANGHQISARGRIPTPIAEAYAAAGLN